MKEVEEVKIDERTEIEGAADEIPVAMKPPKVDVKSLVTNNKWPCLMSSQGVDVVWGPDGHIAITSEAGTIVFSGEITRSLDPIKRQARDGLNVEGRSISLPEWAANALGIGPVAIEREEAMISEDTSPPEIIVESPTETSSSDAFHL